MNRAIVHPLFDGGSNHAVLINGALALELGRADRRAQMIGGAGLVGENHLGARQRRLDHPLNLGEIGHETGF